jgi:hypothetical protein
MFMVSDTTGGFPNEKGFVGSSRSTSCPSARTPFMAYQPSWIGGSGAKRPQR